MENSQLKKLEQLRADYRFVFGTESGERVLKDIEGYGFFTRCMYDPRDPQGIYVREGMRNIVLRIHAMISQDTPKPITEGEDDAAGQ